MELQTVICPTCLDTFRADIQIPTIKVGIRSTFSKFSCPKCGNSVLIELLFKVSNDISKCQSDPIPNNSTAIWDLVIQDMKGRHEYGVEKYGTPLQINNGRDFLVDAYQELLDLAVYLRAEIEERSQK